MLVRSFQQSFLFLLHNHHVHSGQYNLVGSRCSGRGRIPKWRYCLDAGLDSPGLDNGSRRRVLLLWSTKTEKCTVHDIPQYDDRCRCFISSAYQKSTNLRSTDSDIKWFFWGFSLTFSETGGRFIGDLRKFQIFTTYGG
jgi:hypothetical protein